MYLQLLTEEEQQTVVRALRGPQFDRKLHGGLFDRGSADSYYGRPRDPHWYPEGSYEGEPVESLTPAEIQEYLAGYDHNEQYGHKKDYN
jgi:hypothetical protein